MVKTTRTISTSPDTELKLEILKRKYGTYSRAIAIAVSHEVYEIEETKTEAQL